MSALPITPAKLVRDKLGELGFEETQYQTYTGTVWVHLARRRHLIVPQPDGGVYPPWLFDFIVQSARAVGDDATADALTQLDPWTRLREKPRKRGKPAP